MAFAPRNVLGVVGIILGLIALYLVLTMAAGANSLLGTLASGSLGLVGALQGRNVSAGGVSVSGKP